MKRLALLLLLVDAQAFAQDTAIDATIYESIEEIDIGRVFLSPRQRASLDIERLQPKPSGEPLPAKQTEVSSSVASPAGFIISSRGTQRRWVGNQFASENGDALSAMSFPGDIRIVRHSSDERNPDAERGDTASDDGRSAVDRDASKR